MSFYRDIAKGYLRLTLIISPPRTASTALARVLSLSPSCDLYIHEPFACDYNGDVVVREGTEIITREVERLKQKRHYSRSHPLNIVIKEMSQHLKSQLFRRLYSVCDRIILMIRSPHNQLSSLMKMWKNNPDDDRFSLSRISPRDRDRFVKSDEYRLNFVSSWNLLQRYLRTLSNLEKYTPGNPCWIAVDGDLIRALPSMLKNVVNRVGFSYSECMVFGWKRSARKSSNTDNDNWVGRVMRSRKLHKLKRMTPLTEHFPESTHLQISKVMRIYLEFLSSDRIVRPTRPKDLRLLLGTPLANGHTFASLRPVTSYALASTLGDQYRRQKRIILEELRMHFSQRHNTAFRRIDELVESTIQVR